MSKLCLVMAAYGCLTASAAAESRPQPSKFGDVYVVSARDGSVRHIARERYGVVWSPDGRLIADEAVIGRYVKVEVRTAHGRLLRRFHAGTDGGWPSWSPDGRRLAYIRSYANRRRHATDGELVVRSVDGDRPAVLTRLATADRPAWSADGLSLFYVRGDIVRRSSRTPITDPGIWRIAADGSGDREVVAHVDPAPPLLSPSGRRILFYRPRRDNLSELWTARSHGSDPLHTRTGPFASGARWAPRGQRIWLTVWRRRYREHAILLDVHGRLRRLPRAIDGEGDWSPDGRWIAWARGERIERIRPNGKGRELILRFADPGYDSYTSCGSLRWSPDSSALLVTCFRGFVR